MIPFWKIKLPGQAPQRKRFAFSSAFVHVMEFFGFRMVGALPPEPPPNLAQIPYTRHLTNELRSIDGRFVVRIVRGEDFLYRAHSFTWVTHADDDVWIAFWTEHALGVIGDLPEPVIDEARRQIEAYEIKKQRI